VAAGGRIISPGRVPGSIIAIAEDSDILARLYQSGALLVLRADNAVGCITIAINEKTKIQGKRS
jgi:hypothetical protein